MSGNLIDNQVKKYQQANLQPGMQSPINTNSQYFRAGENTVDKTPDQDTFEGNDTKKDSGYLQPLLIFASWFGVNKLADLFDKGCSGDNYDKTIVGRLGNFGDHISEKTKDNRFIKSIKGIIGSIKSRTTTFINNNKTLSAMFNTPTLPENKFVIGMIESQETADLSHAAGDIKKYIKEVPKTLKEAGATKEEIQALKAKYGTNMFGRIKNLKKALQELQFNRIGAPENFIDTLDPKDIKETLKKMKIEHLGIDPKDFERILENPVKYKSTIIEACRRGGKNARTTHWTPLLRPLTKHYRNLSISYNRLISETKHTSKLGRGLARGSKLFVRGMTFGGGKLNSLLVALGLGTALYNAYKAPKEQKVGTAVAGGFDAMSWIISMPLAVKLMHMVSGLQYKGMSKTSVKKYRKALKIFNRKADMGKFKDQEAYNKALEKVMSRKPSTAGMNKLQKGVHYLAKFVGIGLETPHSYKESTKGLSFLQKVPVFTRNLMRKLPRGGKNLVGYPLRFALYVAVCEPLINKGISLVTSAIFGKPYEPEENEEKENEDNNEQVKTMPPTNPQEINEQNPKPVQEPKKPVDINNLPDNNLIKRTTNGEDVVNHPVKTIPEERYIPSETCEIEGIKSPYDVEERSYIPSEESTIQSSYDADKTTVDEAIAKAEKAEARAMEVLNGIY